jgi:ABC-type sugar transport system permease subunit
MIKNNVLHSRLSTASAARKKPRLHVQESLWGLLLVLPAFAVVLVFKILPVLAGLWTSFTEWSALSAPKWIGLANYVHLIKDKVVPQVLGNTFFYAGVSTPLTIVFSLLIAIALNQKIKGIGFFRTAYYIPVITATVAVSVIWIRLLSDHGLINTFLHSLHFKSVNFLNSTSLSLPSIVLVDVWKNMGFNIIIFLAALQDVPEDIRDAAKVDGANRWQSFIHITLPMISPAIFFVAMMAIIGSLQSFDLIYNMSVNHLGGPARSTSTMGFYIWQNAFRYSKMGYAAALSFVLMLILLTATLIQWRVRKLWVYGEEQSQ